MASVSAVAPTGFKDRLLELAGQHPCASHRLFEELPAARLDTAAVARLLRNYDAHASVLRRLLLLAATVMPEPAVGFVLENVRNEYGNGQYCDNHQGQLRDVAASAGVDNSMWKAVSIEGGVKRFIKQAPQLYFPVRRTMPAGSRRSSTRLAAVAAGAITATEILAVSEFKALQQAFTPLGLAQHRWFNHVLIEEEHSDESLMLALYFADECAADDDVEKGLKGILDANCDLYDGLLAALLGS